VATSSKTNNAYAAVLGNYLTKTDEKSLSDYFTSSGALNVAEIRRELTEYICSLRSSPEKRDALEEIFEFWALLYSSDKIPLNPLEGMEREVPESQESRRLKLIQSIQAGPKTIEELQQILWVSEGILQADLRDLCEGKGLFPLELEVQIKNKKVRYSCSVNPIYMAYKGTTNAIIKKSLN